MKRAPRPPAWSPCAGAGGIGKTRLLLRLIDGPGADDFPDGTYVVGLADLRQPDLVAARVAAVIGVSRGAGARPLLDTLADALRPRRLLLALDNCEHLIDACASLCQRLLASAPGLRWSRPAGSRCGWRPRRCGRCRRWTCPPAGTD